MRLDSHGARGPTPCSRGVHDDYNNVSVLPADVEAEVRRSFLTELENSIEPLVHLVSLWEIAKAHDFARLNVETPWELRTIRPILNAYTKTWATRSG